LRTPTRVSTAKGAKGIGLRGHWGARARAVVAQSIGTLPLGTRRPNTHTHTQLLMTTFCLCPPPSNALYFMSITTPAANAYPQYYAYRAREFRGGIGYRLCLHNYNTIHNIYIIYLSAGGPEVPPSALRSFGTLAIVLMMMGT
jgi:hypothetical protein